MTAKKTASRLFAIASVLALGLMLAGCDKCGDWPGQSRAGLQACKGVPAK